MTDSNDVTLPDETVAAARAERGGRPSASGASRWLNCPGSFLAEQSVPVEEVTTTASAVRGRDLHELIENYGNLFPNRLLLPLPEPEDFEELEEDDFWMLRNSVLYRNEVVQATWGEAVPGEARGLVYREYRGTVRDADGGVVVSGRIDEAIAYEDTVLIVDYKSGRGSVQLAQENDQLLCDHVCLRLDRPSELVTFSIKRHAMAIVQPLAEGLKKWTYGERTALEIQADVDRIILGARKAMVPGQPRVAGFKQCEWCDFRSRCPEANAASFDVVEQAKGFDLDTPVTPDELDKIALAEKVLAEFKRARYAQALERLKADPEALPGWRVRPGRRTVEVSDARQAFARLSDTLEPGDFAEACKVSLPKLAKAFATTTNMTKPSPKTGKAVKLSQADCRKLVEERLEDITEVKIGEEGIQRK